MQDQRGNLDESHVPAPRDPADDTDTDTDTDTVTDARADARDGSDESYPAGTYASGSAVTDTDRDELTDRDDVEVVDHDQALADEREADELEAHEVEAHEVEAHEENEARGDDDFVPADVDPPADERDESETAVTEDAEDAEDRAWAAEHATQLRAGSLQDDDDAPAQPYEGAVGGDTSEDRAWAAEHATQLRAGSLPDAEPVDAEATDAEPDDAASEALEGGEALDAGDVVAVPADLRPGAVEAVPVGAIWADGAADGLRGRWRELQLRFIDDPRSVAGEADQLVAEAVATVTGALESQRARLGAWQGEGGEDTERLRAAVRQYRDFLDRLLGL